ncbi:zincbinding dehydrogenase family oxidoreductase [Acanthamoeba castellanii str. Neff]|uniref:Zincbinding dehydrogenase family oxidoreductase n=1 Tax=Acanthamoeba castellanii (strain ATCC 30010 / Neff) TaxID=1257118 RepID=L8H100_ACACF|nr:zincbinding dehydrogenase family oxidoreductase [Acanthamoeba castellanii str. Neff]ELR18448.1 zincbinding dehydrogenase family oxidoreductase [Acanthamoeba castellanii str. Neff]
MSQLPASTKAITLAHYPKGLPTLDTFHTVELPLPAELQPGEVALRAEWLSVDPYLRGRMREGAKSYVPPFELNKPIVSGIVARVIASKDDNFKVGDRAISLLPWQDYIVINPSTHPAGPPFSLQKLDKFPPGVSFSNAVGALGMPGLTAYFGLLDIGDPKEGETVFVSGAAGAVGSLVGQIAKLKGCRVVGSAGDDEKVAWLKEELGFDDAFNYKTVGDLNEAVAKACPKGVDVYFDNVGGAISDAVTLQINPYGRISVCGQISAYNEDGSNPTATTGPRHDWILLTRNVKKEGFIVGRPAWAKRYPEALAQLAGWVASGQIKVRETVVEGLESAPKAFLNLFDGSNTGKMVVKVAADAQ